MERPLLLLKGESIRILRTRLAVGSRFESRFKDLTRSELRSTFKGHDLSKVLYI